LSIGQNAGFSGFGESDPTSAQEGDFYYRVDLQQWRWYHNGAWQAIPASFTKGGVLQSPVAGTTVIWVAPFACTVKRVRGYQDAGTGSVMTALHGALDLLVTDITIGTAAAWQDGGAVQNTSFASGDSLAIKVTSVSGSPNYITVQVDFTAP